MDRIGCKIYMDVGIINYPVHYHDDLFQENFKDLEITYNITWIMYFMHNITVILFMKGFI